MEPRYWPSRERVSSQPLEAMFSNRRPDSRRVQFKGSVIQISYSYNRTYGHHVETICLYTQLGQPKFAHPIIPVGRELERRMSAFKDILTWWLATCNAEHSACPKGNSPLPSHVLNLGSIDSDQIRLHIGKGHSESYSALSYCWVKVKQRKPPRRTTKPVLKEFLF